MHNKQTLKKDHENRPLWVCPNGVVYMEANSVLYKEAYDFLVAVSEPISRPEHIHKYKLTTTSLLAAVSIGLNTELILRTLRKFSKAKLPDTVKNFIEECTMTCGKTKLVLRKRTILRGISREGDSEHAAPESKD